MCFSAEASFVAGIALSVAGVATLRMAKSKKELPFASVPLIFGVHQIVEGFVWLSLRFDLSLINFIATNIYLFFARGFWPIFFPLAVLLLESVPWRKKVLFGFWLTGIVAGSYFLYIMIAHPMGSSLVNGHIVYSSKALYVAHFWEVLFFLYMLGTNIGALFSSYPTVRLMGVFLFISGLISYYLYITSFASIWCFFAALLSILIYLHFRYRDRETEKG